MSPRTNHSSPFCKSTPDDWLVVSVPTGVPASSVPTVANEAVESRFQRLTDGLSLYDPSPAEGRTIKRRLVRAFGDGAHRSRVSRLTKFVLSDYYENHTFPLSEEISQTIINRKALADKFSHQAMPMRLLLDDNDPSRLFRLDTTVLLPSYDTRSLGSFIACDHQISRNRVLDRFGYSLWPSVDASWDDFPPRALPMFQSFVLRNGDPSSLEIKTGIIKHTTKHDTGGTAAKDWHTKSIQGAFGKVVWAKGGPDWERLVTLPTQRDGDGFMSKSSVDLGTTQLTLSYGNDGRGPREEFTSLKSEHTVRAKLQMRPFHRIKSPPPVDMSGADCFEWCL